MYEEFDKYNDSDIVKYVVFGMGYVFLFFCLIFLFEEKMENQAIIAQYQEISRENAELEKNYNQVKYEYDMAIAPKIYDDDVFYLALTMWGEARNQGSKGMKEVGKTILARAFSENRARQWGYGIVGVSLHYKQFSCWNPWDNNYPKIMAVMNDPKKGGETFRLALHIATELLAEKPNDGFVYYHAKEITPYWASDKVGKVVGSHIFYDNSL